MPAVDEADIKSTNAWLPVRIPTRNVQSKSSKQQDNSKQSAFVKGSVNITQEEKSSNCHENKFCLRPIVSVVIILSSPCYYLLLLVLLLAFDDFLEMVKDAIIN